MEEYTLASQTSYPATPSTQLPIASRNPFSKTHIVSLHYPPHLNNEKAGTLYLCNWCEICIQQSHALSSTRIFISRSTTKSFKFLIPSPLIPPSLFPVPYKFSPNFRTLEFFAQTPDIDNTLSLTSNFYMSAGRHNLLNPLSLNLVLPFAPIYPSLWPHPEIRQSRRGGILCWRRQSSPSRGTYTGRCLDSKKKLQEQSKTCRIIVTAMATSK